MIPKGPVYASLREKALFFYQEATRFGACANNFTAWINAGAYAVDSISNREIVIDASPSDVSAVFFNEVEYCFNSALEQIQEVACYSEDVRVRSAGWNIVTLYYLLFYSVQGLLRLLGHPVMFLTKDCLKHLEAISNGGASPSAGCYSFEKIEELGVGMYRFHLKKNKRTTLHDASWGAFINVVKETRKKILAQSDLDEVVFYDALENKSVQRVYGTDCWPSRIRARANYVFGFAYTLVEDKDVCKSKRNLIRWLKMDETTIKKTFKR